MADEESKSPINPTEGISGIDKSGHKTVNEYALLKTLGRGSYGKVKLCNNRGSLFATKVFRKSLLFKRKNYIPTEDGDIKVTTGFSDVEREIAIMKKLTHTNVVRLKDVIYDENTDKLYIMMEYCSIGPLLTWDEDQEIFHIPWTDEKLPEEKLRKIIRDMVCGLEYLHYHGISHRDIKPENILITED